VIVTASIDVVRKKTMKDGDRQTERYRRRSRHIDAYRELIGFQQSAVFPAKIRVRRPEKVVCWTAIIGDPLVTRQHPDDDIRDAVLRLKPNNMQVQRCFTIVKIMTQRIYHTIQTVTSKNYTF